MRCTRLIVLFGLSLLSFFGLGRSALGQTAGDAAKAPSPFKTEPLRVGVTPDSPPLVFKIDGQFEGVEIDLARLLGKELRRPVVFVDLPWEDQIDALHGGKIDLIMSGMTVTREREKVVAFSPPYLNFGQMALVRERDRARYTSIRSFLDTVGNVAVIPETTGADFVKQHFRNASIVEYATPTEAVDAVVTSKADAFVYDSPVIRWLAGKREMENVKPVNISLTMEYLAWAMRPQDRRLQDQVAQALFTFEEDGRLRAVLDRWLPDRR